MNAANRYILWYITKIRTRLAMFCNPLNSNERSESWKFAGKGDALKPYFLYGKRAYPHCFGACETVAEMGFDLLSGERQSTV
jgi:hypothetical protein